MITDKPLVSPGPSAASGPFVRRPRKVTTPPLNPFDVLTDENDNPLLDQSDDPLKE